MNIDTVRYVNAKIPKPIINDVDDCTRLKLKINNLLWEELPGNVTLEKAEIMACDFMKHILDSRDMP